MTEEERRKKFAEVVNQSRTSTQPITRQQYVDYMDESGSTQIKPTEPQTLTPSAYKNRYGHVINAYNSVNRTDTQRADDRLYSQWQAYQKALDAKKNAQFMSSDKVKAGNLAKSLKEQLKAAFTERYGEKADFAKWLKSGTMTGLMGFANGVYQTAGMVEDALTNTANNAYWTLNHGIGGPDRWMKSYFGDNANEDDPMYKVYTAYKNAQAARKGAGAGSGVSGDTWMSAEEQLRDRLEEMYKERVGDNYLFDPEGGALHQLAERSNELYNWNQEQNQIQTEFQKARSGNDKAWDIANQLVIGTAQAVPYAAFGMAGMGAAGGEMGAQLAPQTTNILEKVASTIQGYVKDPNYWLAFSQETGNTYREALDAGANQDTAALTATLVGLINGAVELGLGGDNAGIQDLPERLMKAGKGTRKAVQEWIESAVSEGKEEVIQGVISNLAEKVGYNRSKAWIGEGGVIDPKALAQEGYMGMTVGGILGGGQIAGVNAYNRAAQNRVDKANAAIGARYSEQADTIIQNARQMGPETQSYQLASDILEKGSHTDADIGALYRAYMGDTGYNQSLRANTIQAVQQRLTELGETSDTREIAEIIAKQADGQKLTKAETQAIENSKYGQRVVNELFNAYRGDYSSNWVRGLATQDEMTTAKAAPELTQEQRAERIEQARSTEQQAVTDAELPKTIETMAARYGAEANVFKEAVKSSTPEDIYEFNTAYETVYQLAKAGVAEATAMEAMQRNSARSDGYRLSNQQFKLAYESGVRAGVRANENAPKRTRFKKGAVHINGINYEKLNGKQKASVRVLMKLAEATGVDVELFQSTTDENGNYTGYQGKYEDGKIYIDINAGLMSESETGNLASYAMLRTASHEFTHYLQRNATKEYAALKQAVFSNLQRFSEDGKYRTADEWIGAVMEQTGRDYDYCSNECVARACEMMLRDSTAFETLAKENRNVAQRFIDWLKEFIADIKAAFEGVVENRLEAKAMLDDLEHIQKLWDEAMVAAVRNTKQNAESGTQSEAQYEERFTSVSQPVERTKDLIALHNLNESKLLKALKLGGFPMPSIAVTKTSIPHTNFGDITLVMDKSTVDPQYSRKNTVYSADAWTPTFPQIEYEVNEKVADKLRTKYYELYRKFGNDATRPLYPWGNYAEDELNRAGGEAQVMERAKNDVDMMKLYLMDEGFDVPETVTEEKIDRLDDGTIRFYDHFINALGEDAFRELIVQPGQSIMQMRKDWWAKHGEAFENAYREYMADLGFSEEEMNNVLDHETVSSQTRKALEMRNYINNGPEKRTVTTNTEATNNAIRAAVDEDAYNEWLHDLFDGLQKNEGIYNNRDRYTSSGNRRSFSATHYDVTLENIAKAMASQNDGNSRNVDGFYGVKSLRAGMAERFDSIERMHELEGRLQHLTEEEAEEINNALSARLTDVMQRIYDTKAHGAYDNSFIEMDSIGNMLMEATETRPVTDEAIVRAFKNSGYLISHDLAEDVRELLFDVAQMPVNIFEAKPERAVRFDEVLAAVVPDTVSTELREKLQSLGVDTIEYEHDNDEARLAAVNSVQGAQFEERYWSPKLDHKEWSLLNYKMNSEIESSDKWLDDFTKWLYAEEKGVRVFAIYGIGDGTEPTPLYASGGNSAVVDYNAFKNELEGFRHVKRDQETYPQWFKSLRDERRRYRNGNVDASETRSGRRNARLDVGGRAGIDASDTEQSNRTSREVRGLNNNHYEERMDTDTDEATEGPVRQKSSPYYAKSDLRKDMLNLFSIPSGMRAEMGTLVDQYADKMLAEGKLTQEDYDELIDALYKKGVMSYPALPDMADARKLLASKRVYVPERIKPEFGDDWNAFRKRAFAAGLYLTSNESDPAPDLWNVSLSRELPGFFQESETDDREILERMVELAEEGKDKKMSLAEYTAQLAKEGFIDEEQFNYDLERKVQQALEKFAEKARIEITMRGRAERLMDRQRALLDRYKRRRETTAVRNKIKSLMEKWNSKILANTPNKNIPAQFAQAVSELSQALDLTSGRQLSEKAQDKLTKLKAAYDSIMADKDFSILADPVAKQLVDNAVDAINNTPLRQMGREELDTLYDAMKALNKVIFEANRLRDKAYKYDLYQTGKAMMMETNEANAIKWETLRDINTWQLTPERFFAMLGGMKKNSVWETQVAESFKEGTRRALRVERDFYNTFKAFTEAPEMDRLVNTNKLIDVGLLGKDGKSVKLTRGMALSLYMHLLADDNRRAILYGGLNIPVFDKYYGGKIASSYATGHENAVGILADMTALADEIYEVEANDSLTDEQKTAEYERIGQEQEKLESEGYDRLDALKNRIYDQMTDFEKKLCETVTAWNDGKSRDYINEVTMEMYGIKRAKVKNYYRIHRDTSFVQTDFEGISKNLNLTNVGWLKDRVKSAAPVLLTDITYEMDNGVKQLATYYGYVKAQTDFTKLYNFKQRGANKSVKDSVKSKFGGGEKAFGVTADQYVENLIGDVVGSRAKAPTSMWAVIRRNLPRATLSLNPRVALSQIASVPTAAAEVGWGPMLKGFVRGLPTALSKDAKTRLMNKDEYFFQRYRGDGSMREFADMKSGNNVIDKLWNKADKLTHHALLNWCQNCDVFATSTMWAMAEEWVKDNTNLTGEEFDTAVKKKYDDIITKTQPNYTTTERSDLLRDTREIYKLFTMYKTQSNQNYNILWEANARLKKTASDLKNGRNGVTQQDLKEARKRFANAYTALFIGATPVFVMLRALANALLAHMNDYRDDDDEITAVSTLNGLTKAYIQSLSGMFVLGTELENAVESVVSGKLYYGMSDSATSAVGNTAESLVKLAQAYAQGKTDNIGGKWAKLAQNALTTLGLPYNSVKTFVEGGKAWMADIERGTFGSFEGAVTRTNSVNYNRLYKALENGDTAKADRIREEIRRNSPDIEDKTIESGLREVIKGMWSDGLITTNEAVDKLVEYTGKDPDTAYWDVQKWYNKANAGEDEEYANSNYYRLWQVIDNDGDAEAAMSELLEHGKDANQIATDVRKHIKEAFEDGTITEKEAADRLVKYGTHKDGKSYTQYSQKEANELVSKWAESMKLGWDYDDKESLYASGDISKSDLKNALVNIGGMTSDKADEKIVVLDWQNEGYEDITYAAIKEYNNGPKSSGVSHAIWYKYWLAEKSMQADYKANGDTIPYSKMIKVFQYIGNLNITNDQKYALAKTYTDSDANIAKYKTW